MYWSRHLFVRVILVTLLLGLQACGSGGESSDDGGSQNGSNDPVDTSGDNSGDSGFGGSTSGDATPGDATSGDSSSGDSTSSAGNGSTGSGGDSGSSSGDGSNSAVIFSETFEGTDLDTQPAGWDNFLNYNYNTGNSVNNGSYALVDDTHAYNGNHSIHFKGSLAQIVRALPDNTQRVHLRAYIRMSKQMGNVAGDNHEHIMGIKKTQDANNEVRIGQIKGVLGTNDVPTDNIAPTSARWESGKALLPDTWYCVETALYADTAYDEVYMWVDGEEVHSITSDSDWNNGALGKDWMSDKFNYVMFGFQSFSGNTADVWMDDIVVSREPVGCGEMPATGDGSTSGDSTSGGSTSGDNTSGDSTSGDSTSGDGNATVGDASHGATLYDTQCASCHGTEGAGPKPIDATKMSFGTNSQTLADYIVDTMPPRDTVSCSGTCAADIAAFIDGWGSGGSASDSTPPVSCEVAYGPRTIRVLTRSEFVNSIEDLTGVDVLADLGRNTYDTIPVDNMINGFSNNVMTSISSGSLQAYAQVVDKVVEHLSANGFADVIDCSQLTDDVCAYSFIENYIPRVIRRPLSEDEIIAFETLFTADYTGGNMYEGLALALKTLFTSPQFLYRDETGVSVADINAGGGGSGQYEQVGTIQAFIDSSDEPHTLAIFGQEGRNASFTGNDLITITVRGTRGPENGLWPTMSIESNNEVIGSVLVNHTFSKTYQFHTTAFNGDYTYFTVLNKQIGAPDEYKGGHNLIISKLELSAAQEVTQTLPNIALDADAYILTPYQLASYLAFTFTGSTPDDTLLQAAADEGLETDAQIAAQVERLLRTPRAREHFGDFAAQWLRTDGVLNLAKDPMLYPNFTNEVRQAMAQEVREVFNHVVLDEGEPFSALYDGDFTFANTALADFYGIGSVSGSEMQKVTDVTSRAGLITSGAFLAVHAHEKETGPILRATYLRRRFLCHDVPIPPTGVSLNVDFDVARQEAVDEWEAYLTAHNGLATSRRKYEFQTSADVCQTCHAQMLNPLGGGFEDFDAVGLPQTQDYNGLSIDSYGAMYGVNSIEDGNTITFNGAKEFAHQIANLDVTRQCFVDTGFRMAMGTGSTFLDQTMDIKLSDSEIASYTCEVQKLDAHMKSSGNSPFELLKALGTMDSVRYRKDVAR